MKLLFEHTGNSNEAAAGYLQLLDQHCGACRLIQRPKPSCNVILSSLHRKCNNVVCTDHFFLDGLRVFQFMYCANFYSTGTIPPDLSPSTAVVVLESSYIALFCRLVR